MTLLYNFAKWVQTRILPKELYTRMIFKKIHGYALNLDNPKTLNEKLHWMKLRGPKFIPDELVDKLGVRDYVKKKVGDKYLIPLIAVLDTEEDLGPLSRENYPCIVKPTHDSGVGIVYHSADDINLESDKRILKSRLRVNHYHSTKEYPYRYLKPKIIIERLLSDGINEFPNDYKFHMFNGRLEFVYCSLDRSMSDKRQIFSPEWERLPFSWNKSTEKFDLRQKNVAKPKNYEEMVDVAKLLSEGFPYVRIDLYNIDGAIFCGEMTFFQGSGFDKITPFETDLELGSKIDIVDIQAKYSGDTYYV